ncbi:MAG: exodeoxyribonuclease I [Bacteroidetes bacterium]|nr:exodeoxyribonuclease I [Bacteroidota bacterium]
MQFFWYDYETWGKYPLSDRIVQFGGIRTGEQLEMIGEPIEYLCQPGLDFFIGPGAVNIHGIMPMKAYKEGLPENEFAARIHQELIQDGTCSVAYNGMSFDHEFTRVLFYRNLRDPYEWEYKNGNSRWDTLELMRATYLLRPDALGDWPQKETGGPSFQLEALTRQFLDEDQLINQHDAVSDTIQMWLIAKLVREKVEDLWNYGLTLRNKNVVNSIMSSQEPVLYTVGKIPTYRSCSTALSPLKFQEYNSLYGFDLFVDPAPFLKPFDQWSQSDKTSARKAIFSFNSGKAPFLVLWPDIQRLLPNKWSMNHLLTKIKLSEQDILARHELIQNFDDTKYPNPLIEFVKFQSSQSKAKYSSKRSDPDEAIYDNFFSHDDMYMMSQVIEQGPNFDWRSVKSTDYRVEPLIFRYIARNYPDSLDEQGKERWLNYCRERQLLRTHKRWVNPDQVFSYELRDSAKPWGNLNEADVKDLLKWQDRVRERLRQPN